MLQIVFLHQKPGFEEEAGLDALFSPPPRFFLQNRGFSGGFTVQHAPDYYKNRFFSCLLITGSCTAGASDHFILQV
jgi:hypothetical protein